MKGLWRVLAVFVAFMLVLAACGGGGGQQTPSQPAGGAVTGDPQRGEQLFKQTTIGSAPGCITCHSLEPGQTLVGPSLAGIATQAEEIIKSPNYTGKAKTVDEFLREAIVDPNAYVTEGFSPGVMYQNYGKDLTEQQIADLVAFLKTLK